MTMQSSEASATATTPLGAVSLQVDGSPGVTIVVAHSEVPALPNGLSVDGVILITIRVATPVTPDSPLSLRISVGQDGDADTGEWLESMAFASGNGVLQVATRDKEWLAAKGIAAEDVQYGSRGFTQTIREAPAGTSLHVSLAWCGRAAAADDASTWFAADLALPDN